MRATTSADVATLRRMPADDMGACVVTHAELKPRNLSNEPALSELPIIGEANDEDLTPAGKMNWPHGFHLRHVCVDPGYAGLLHQRHEEEVILMHSGALAVELPDGSIELGAGDVLTVPIDSPRRFANSGTAPAEAFVVRGGDQPRPATLTT